MRRTILVCLVVLPVASTAWAKSTVLSSLAGQATIVHVHNLDLTAVDVTFSEALEQTSAEDPAHYTFSGGIQPATAALDASDPARVHLTGITGLAAETVVSLSVEGVETAAGDPSVTSAELVTGIASCAFVRTDADGDFVPDLLEDHPDAFVTVQGVLASAGDFDGRDGRLQDPSGGLGLWDLHQDVLAAAGRFDEIRVSGRLSQHEGLDQLTELQGEVLGPADPVVPLVRTLDELAADPESHESILVAVAGVSDTGGGDPWPAADQEANFEVSDGGAAPMNLFIDSDTDIDGSDEPAWPMDVVGIFSQYDTSDPRSEGYAIQPRERADLEVDLCQDADGDGYGVACEAGPDCDDADDQVHPGAPELCDEVDNDCDEQTDEDWPELGEPCDGSDDDLCPNGVVDCNPEQDGTTCVESIHKSEICNGEDDDCDDAVDEDWRIGEPCDGPDDDKCPNGAYQCNRSGTGITCDEEPGPGIPESCNGRDDDCDGETDELEPDTITCGAGVCEVTVPRCLDGQLQECVPNRSAPAYEEAEESCEDGLDNDCDGFIDLNDANCRGGGGDGGCGCRGTTGSGSSTDGLPVILLLLLGLVRFTKNRSPCG